MILVEKIISIRFQMLNLSTKAKHALNLAKSVWRKSVIYERHQSNTTRKLSKKDSHPHIIWRKEKLNELVIFLKR